MADFPRPENSEIMDVWKHNIEEQFHIIRQVVKKYQWVAIDTELPGVVARPIGKHSYSPDSQYQLMRCNVDLLRIIQMGLSFMDDDGNKPPGCSTWQFNFKFSLTKDMYSKTSIHMLKNSGIQFKKHEEDGIDPHDFAEIIMTSGVVLIDKIKWISFHSGYDFGYFLKMLRAKELPAEESEFIELSNIYFPNIFDIKKMMSSEMIQIGSLQKLADKLGIQRVGIQHQAGSDALLTGMVYRKLRDLFQGQELLYSLLA